MEAFQLLADNDGTCVVFKHIQASRTRKKLKRDETTSYRKKMEKAFHNLPNQDLSLLQCPVPDHPATWASQPTPRHLGNEILERRVEAFTEAFIELLTVNVPPGDEWDIFKAKDDISSRRVTNPSVTGKTRMPDGMSYNTCIFIYIYIYVCVCVCNIYIYIILY